MRDIFDLVSPVSVIATFMFIFLGPLYFPLANILYLFTSSVVLLVFSMSHSFKFRMSASKIEKMCQEFSDFEKRGSFLVEPSLYHVFIIPNYCEPIPLLRKTLGDLSSHPGAFKKYILVLAMEQSERGYSVKAQQLQEEFNSLFKRVIVTSHPVGIAGESRGKGSNVNYAVREAYKILVQDGFSEEQLVLTIADSDSLIPALYINQVEQEMRSSDNPLAQIFCPPIFFGQNVTKVPGSVAIVDLFWSMMMIQNLSNPNGIIFPCSNYSLSMALAKRVGFWDTDFDAIGEDMHMMLKCFFKTNGEARAKSIFVPINLANIQSDTYVSTVKARYYQANRHYLGCADVAYCLRNAVKMPLASCLQICIHSIEAHVIPATSGWILLLGTLMIALLNPHPFEDGHFYYTLMKPLLLINAIPTFFLYF